MLAVGTGTLLAWCSQDLIKTDRRARLDHVLDGNSQERGRPRPMSPPSGLYSTYIEPCLPVLKLVLIKSSCGRAYN